LFLVQFIFFFECCGPYIEIFRIGQVFFILFLQEFYFPLVVIELKKLPVFPVIFIEGCIFRLNRSQVSITIYREG
jgi:hypothetical protein